MEKSKKQLISILIISFSLIFYLNQCTSNDEINNNVSKQNDEIVANQDRMVDKNDYEIMKRDHQGSEMMGRRRMMRGMCCDDMMERGDRKMYWRGLFDTAINPEQLPDKDSKGARKYSKYCNQCHPLQNPKSKSSKQWATLIDRMDRRMQNMSAMSKRWMMWRNIQSMTDKDKEQITKYLKKHSLKTMTENSVKNLKTKAGQIFSQTCSQCHDLPDTKLHTTEEWKVVIQRMKKYMIRQGIPMINSEKEKFIFDFLKENASD